MIKKWAREEAWAAGKGRCGVKLGDDAMAGG
jgi:hypothetical protein